MGRILVGNASNAANPSPNTPEDAAREYFSNWCMAGSYAPRPQTRRWRKDQRDRFEAELARLVDKRDNRRARVG